MGKGVGVLWTGKKKRAPGVAGPSGTGDDLNRAVLYMVFAAVLIPLLNASAKYLTSTYSVLEITWARYAGQFAYMLIAFAPQRGLSLLAADVAAGALLAFVRLHPDLCHGPALCASADRNRHFVHEPLHCNRACPIVARRGRGAVPLVRRSGRVLGRADRGAAGHYGYR